MDIVNRDTLKKIITKLYYKAPSCPDYVSPLQKCNLQKPSNIPHLETNGLPISTRKMYLTKYSRLKLE